MDPRFQLRTAELGSVKAKAVEDARQMQVKVIEECKRDGKDPPPYGLEELIGKGSFGRVYKGKDMKNAAVVAVKIIDIDESDTVNPRNANSYSEFLKEVNALKILSESKAKNINHVIEALPVGKSMWMITEYCGGGSVATLMKPTAPGGLQEKWIIPIVREAAEALKWVHQAEIIHRDIKCANVLVTEKGEVQLCDFGVAGINETKIDKRATIVGTPHWMAPELFEAPETVSYGKEVDIWALGAMVFEMATGLPPNAIDRVQVDQLGAQLRKKTPRLEGGNYSSALRSLVAYCLEENPKLRPTIEQVQKHDYIFNTAASYPTYSLRALVGSFKTWETRGGSRMSLFFQFGAQNASPSQSPVEDEWNFSTTEAFDKRVAEEFSASDVFDAYGPAVVDFDDETARPSRLLANRSRRRPPPEAIGRLPAQPLEKIFDPNTMSNYDDNSRAHYGGSARTPLSDLPLRDNSAQTSIRDTQIDLGSHDPETGISSFSDMDTIKAQRRRIDIDDDLQSDFSRPALSDPADNNKNRKTIEWTFEAQQLRNDSEDDLRSDFSRPALSDPADNNKNRKTQDWTFDSAMAALPASANPEVSRFPSSSFESARSIASPDSGGRPLLYHHPTEPVGGFGGGLAVQSQPDRRSMNSLIDLDASVPDQFPDILRPSTANSDSANPFEFERHASTYQPGAVREPSIYVSDNMEPISRLISTMSLREAAEISDFSASDAEAIRAYNNPPGEQQQYPASVEDDEYSDGSDSSDGSDEDDDQDGDDDATTEKGGPSDQGVGQMYDSAAGPTRRGGRWYDPGPGRGKPIFMGGPPLRPGQSLPGYTPSHRPAVPRHPARPVLTGKVTSTELKAELNRILHGVHDQMVAFKGAYESSAQVPPVRGSSLGGDGASAPPGPVPPTTSSRASGRGSGRGTGRGFGGSSRSAGPGQGPARPSE